MCSSKTKVTAGIEITTTIARINGRPVLQPTCNRVPSLQHRPNSIKKISLKPPPSPPPPPPPSIFGTSTTRTKASLTPPISPKSKSPRPPPAKRASQDTSGLNSSSEKVLIPSRKTLERKKSKSITARGGDGDVAAFANAASPNSFTYSSSLIVEAPGSIAAGRREQMALQQVQRKMKIAHYGRSKSAKFQTEHLPTDSSNTMNAMPTTSVEVKRCSFITTNSDPIYVAYHDEEWGVPVHDDNMLFELLVLSGAQVGSDWTSILKKRQYFRNAFSGFDAETVANFTEKQLTSISAEYGIDISRVRGVFDNSIRILELKREFGSFEKYIWGFVNQKPMCPEYKFGHKIPAKISKSESISKDMVRRGFRFVGPTVVHSFMQAAGLTNDHLITCHRHLQCSSLPN